MEKVKEKILLSDYIKLLEEKLEKYGDMPVVFIYDGISIYNEKPSVYTGVYDKELVLFMS